MMANRLRIVEVAGITIDLMPDGRSLHADFTVPGVGSLSPDQAIKAYCSRCGMPVIAVAQEVTDAVIMDKPYIVSIHCTARGGGWHVWTMDNPRTA